MKHIQSFLVNKLTHFLVKIIYTFDKTHQSPYLARAPAIIDVPVVDSQDETPTSVGFIDISPCLETVCRSSPEILSTDSNDYVVYSKDLSEGFAAEGIFVGHGFLSTLLSKNEDQNENREPVYVTGKVSKNILPIYTQETLEIHLRLSPVLRSLQSHYVDSLRQYKSLSNLEAPPPARRSLTVADLESSSLSNKRQKSVHSYYNSQYLASSPPSLADFRERAPPSGAQREHTLMTNSGYIPDASTPIPAHVTSKMPDPRVLSARKSRQPIRKRLAQDKDRRNLLDEPSSPITASRDTRNDMDHLSPQEESRKPSNKPSPDLRTNPGKLTRPETQTSSAKSSPASDSQLNKPISKTDKDSTSAKSSTGSPDDLSNSSGDSNRASRQQYKIDKRLVAALAAGKIPTYCENCGCIRTATWRRFKSEEDDFTLCNPCGLWWSVKKTMRPKELWGPKKGKKTNAKDINTYLADEISRQEENRSKHDDPKMPLSSPVKSVVASLRATANASIKEPESVSAIRSSPVRSISRAVASVPAHFPMSEPHGIELPEHPLIKQHLVTAEMGPELAANNESLPADRVGEPTESSKISGGSDNKVDQIKHSNDQSFEDGALSNDEEADKENIPPYDPQSPSPMGMGDSNHFDIDSLFMTPKKASPIKDMGSLTPASKWISKFIQQQSSKLCEEEDIFTAFMESPSRKYSAHFSAQLTSFDEDILNSEATHDTVPSSPPPDFFYNSEGNGEQHSKGLGIFTDAHDNGHHENQTVEPDTDSSH